jgi:hypothetical protein
MYLHRRLTVIIYSISQLASSVRSILKSTSLIEFGLHLFVCEK